MYTGPGVHEVYRATPVPQPIPNTEMATQYQLSKTHLLRSWDKTNFAEVSEQELSTHCWGSHRRRLCKQPFSTTKSQKTSCLTGLFFNLPATVLNLCAQEVVAFPQHPQAVYLYDSTYLLTSAKGDFMIQNMTACAEIRVPGCQSCLVRPSCNGRLQLPNVGLFLTPDPISCMETDGSEIVRILPTPLLQPLLDNLKSLEEVIPLSLMGDVHQELLSHLKLNLAGLPDPTVTEEMLDAIALPFLVEVEKVHSTVIRKIWKDGILPCSVTLLMLIIIAVVGWAVKWGKIYAVRRWMTAVLRGGEVQRHTATAVDDVPEESRVTTPMPTQPQPATSSVHEAKSGPLKEPRRMPRKWVLCDGNRKPNIITHNSSSSPHIYLPNKKLISSATISNASAWYLFPFFPRALVIFRLHLNLREDKKS